MVMLTPMNGRRRRRSAEEMEEELSFVALKAVDMYVRGCRGQERERLSPFGQIVWKKMLSGLDKIL